MDVDIRTIPKGKRLMVSRRGNAFDVARIMQSIVKQSLKDGTIKEFVRKHPMNEKEIFDYVYGIASFKPDLANKQVIKTPLATVRTHRANCVCYSVLLATLLKLNKIDGWFRLVSFKKGMPKHVYIVTKTGKTLDCVLGQPQDREVSRAERENKTGKFNEEVDSFSKFDVPY